MGESDTLHCVGIDFFGDIYAESKGLVCLVIDKPDLSLELYEQEILRDAIGSQHHDLLNMLETRFS